MRCWISYNRALAGLTPTALTSLRRMTLAINCAVLFLSQVVKYGIYCYDSLIIQYSYLTVAHLETFSVTLQAENIRYMLAEVWSLVPLWKKEFLVLHNSRQDA